MKALKAESREDREREIERAKTAAGGWRRATLLEWGVPWPPPKGWKERLLRCGEFSE